MTYLVFFTCFCVFFTVLAGTANRSRAVVRLIFRIFRVLLCFHRCDSFNPPITYRKSCSVFYSSECQQPFLTRTQPSDARLERAYLSHDWFYMSFQEEVAISLSLDCKSALCHHWNRSVTGFWGKHVYIEVLSSSMSQHAMYHAESFSDFSVSLEHRQFFFLTSALVAKIVRRVCCECCVANRLFVWLVERKLHLGDVLGNVV